MLLDYFLIFLLIIDQRGVGQASFKISKLLVYVLESIEHDTSPKENKKKSPQQCSHYCGPSADADGASAC
jgi:hypothetical protein